VTSLESELNLYYLVAAHCGTLPIQLTLEESLHTATHYGTPAAHCNALWNTATVLQRTVVHCNCTATHCGTLHLYCNALWYTAPVLKCLKSQLNLYSSVAAHCNARWYTANILDSKKSSSLLRNSFTLQHTKAHQRHTATHCGTLQLY